MARWKVPEVVVPSDPEVARSGEYDKLRTAATLALAELANKRIKPVTARRRALKILERALGHSE